MLGIFFVVAVLVYTGIVFYLVRKYQLLTRDWVIASAVLAAAVGVGVTIHHSNRPKEDDLVAAALSMGPSPLTAQPTVTATRARGTTSSTDIPGVASMIGGLEQRLAAEPNDLKGWVLLAQSYAFIGNTTAADHAISQAVQLGADEAALTERVSLTTRSRQQSPAIDGRPAK